MESNEQPVPEQVGPDQVEVLGDGRTRPSGWGKPAAFVAAGLVAGGVLAGSVSAMAADGGTPSPSASEGAGSGTGSAGSASGGSVDQSQPQRSDEHLLTGDTATKVRDLALAKYPGATILRVETDSDGVYEAHLVTADGARVTVQVGADFTVTGTQSGPGGPGGAGDHDGDGGRGGTPPSGSPEASPSGSSG